MADRGWDGSLASPEALALRVARVLYLTNCSTRRQLERDAFGNRPHASRAARSALAWLRRRGRVSRSGMSYALSTAGVGWLSLYREVPHHV